jgi:hypothetical protein
MNIVGPLDIPKILKENEELKKEYIPVKGEINNAYKAVRYFGKSVYSKDGEFCGYITAVFPNSVETYRLDRGKLTFNYPVYYGVIWNKENNV